MVAHVIARRCGPRQCCSGSLRRSERAQIIETVEARAMAIAEIKAQRVVADLLPAEHGNSRETLRSVTAILISKNIPLADVRSAWRSRAEFFKGKIRFHPVVPRDRHFLADHLDVHRCVHWQGQLDFIPLRKTATFLLRTVAIFGSHGSLYANETTAGFVAPAHRRDWSRIRRITIRPGISGELGENHGHRPPESSPLSAIALSGRHCGPLR